MGRCRFRLGEYAAARAAFERALRLGAGGPFHRAWVYLRLGNMAEHDENLAKARACYERAVRQGMRYEGAKRAARRLGKLDK